MIILHKKIKHHIMVSRDTGKIYYVVNCTGRDIPYCVFNWSYDGYWDGYTYDSTIPCSGIIVKTKDDLPEEEDGIIFIVNECCLDDKRSDLAILEEKVFIDFQDCPYSKYGYEDIYIKNTSEKFFKLSGR